MKYLIFGILILFSLTAQSQEFVSAERGIELADKMLKQQSVELSNMDSSNSDYAFAKMKMKAYQIFKDHVSSPGIDVSESVKMAVLEIKLEDQISDDQYYADAIIDPELQRLKNHLVAIFKK